MGPVSRAASRRQMLGLLGSVGLASVGLAGCADDSSLGSVSGSLKYHTWSNSQLPAMRELVQAFSKKHPEIDVDADVTPDPPYFQKLEAAATSKALPDVFWMHGRQFVLYASAGMLRPIDEVIEQQGIDLSEYPKPLLDLYAYDGKQYAIPRNNNTVGLWYNKRLFDEAGVTYPGPSWTWDDLRDAAAELTDPERGQFGFAATLSNQTGFWNAIYQNEGSVISDDMSKSGYDEPATIEALDWWTGFIRAKSSPTYQQMTETDPFALFQSGKVAMIFDGDWQSAVLLEDAEFADQVGVAVLPQGKRKACILHGSGNVIATNTKHPQACEALVGYLSSVDAQELQSRRGLSGPPAAKSAVQTWLDSAKTLDLAAFTDQIDDGVLFPHSKNTEAWTNLETKHLGDAWSGSTPVEQAATNLARAMNDALAKEHG